MTFNYIAFIVLIAIGTFFVIRARVHLKEAKQFIAQVRRQNAPRMVDQNWTANEAIILRTFLQSPTGIVLLQRARAMEAINAIKGANDVFHTQHSAGRTAGFSDAINWLESLASDQTIQSLSQPTGVQVDMTEDGQQDEAVSSDAKSS